MPWSEASGETMKGRKTAKTRRPKTLKRRNRPKANLRKPLAADANERIAMLTRERDEALERQTATNDVLKIISNFPGDLQPVFDAMLESATRICEAKFGNMFLYSDNAFHAVAVHNAPPVYAAARKKGPIRPSPGSGLGRVAETRKVVQIADLRAEPAYAARDPLVITGVELAGIRTLLAVPMLREGQLVGSFSIFRQEVRPFTDKQIELVQNFSAQAVIAIENARLLNELRESLEQQTASSDVLRAISTSPTDVNPVFEAMLESASRLCNSKLAAVFRFDGELLHLAATENWPAEALATYASRYPMRPNPQLTVGRVVLTKSVVIQEDTLADANYEHAVAQAGGWRRMLGVPMMHDGNVIGVIVLSWQEPGPVLPRYVELLQTFAAQAIIAIENVRLFNELRSRTHELTVSLDNLRTTQDRLVQTEKLASLGQLTAGIAHEIKNPLNFVNNFSGISAELIGELQGTLSALSVDPETHAEIKDLTDTLRGNLEKVVQHGRRADAIVKSMLMHSGETSGKHQSTDINALVEESLNRAYYNARAEQRGFAIKLEKSFDPAAGEADLFPREITRALLNLISNGFYAATKRKAEAKDDNHEPTLAAATRNLGDRVEIRIRDNGSGIPADVKEKMFDPFFTTKPAGEGTGLGLSISHDIIVKQHGGLIEIETEPGKFAEIRVILPRSTVSV